MSDFSADFFSFIFIHWYNYLPINNIVHVGTMWKCPEGWKSRLFKSQFIEVGDSHKTQVLKLVDMVHTRCQRVVHLNMHSSVKSRPNVLLQFRNRLISHSATVINLIIVYQACFGKQIVWFCFRNNAFYFFHLSKENNTNAIFRPKLST